MCAHHYVIQNPGAYDFDQSLNATYLGHIGGIHAK